MTLTQAKNFVQFIAYKLFSNIVPANTISSLIVLVDLIIIIIFYQLHILLLKYLISLALHAQQMFEAGQEIPVHFIPVKCPWGPK